jgi:hypothetical protein
MLASDKNFSLICLRFSDEEKKDLYDCHLDFSVFRHRRKLEEMKGNDYKSSKKYFSLLRIDFQF